jgi:hypothetical protein
MFPNAGNRFQKMNKAALLSRRDSLLRVLNGYRTTPPLSCPEARQRVELELAGIEAELINRAGEWPFTK